MSSLMTTHPVIAALVAYLMLILIFIAFNRNASKVSCNGDEDPYRDEGNGGMSSEDSVRFHTAERARRAFKINW